MNTIAQSDAYVWLILVARWVTVVLAAAFAGVISGNLKKEWSSLRHSQRLAMLSLVLVAFNVGGKTCLSLLDRHPVFPSDLTFLIWIAIFLMMFGALRFQRKDRL